MVWPTHAPGRRYFNSPCRRSERAPPLPRRDQRDPPPVTFANAGLRDRYFKRARDSHHSASDPASIFS